MIRIFEWNFEILRKLTFEWKWSRKGVNFNDLNFSIKFDRKGEPIMCRISIVVLLAIDWYVWCYGYIKWWRGKNVTRRERHPKSDKKTRFRQDTNLVPMGIKVSSIIKHVNDIRIIALNGFCLRSQMQNLENEDEVRWKNSIGQF